MRCFTRKAEGKESVIKVDVREIKTSRSHVVSLRSPDIYFWELNNLLFKIMWVLKWIKQFVKVLYKHGGELKFKSLEPV